MKEFTFDVSIESTVRIKADTEKQARRALGQVLSYSEPTQDFLDGFNDESHIAIIEYFSLSPDDSVYPDGAVLVEVDGEPV